LAGGKDTRPDHILFEYDNENQNQVKSSFNNKRNLYNENDSKYEFQTFFKDGIKYEFFRSYTDCLYSAYGTKWNGNAAAYNGSLFVVQDNRIRRFTPLECERLMGFPDNYTKIDGQSDTSRYKAIGASWPVPVVKWIAERISNQFSYNSLSSFDYLASLKNQINNHDLNLFLLGNVYSIEENFSLNTSEMPNNPIGGNLFDIIQSEVVDEKFFLSSKACKGILRRKEEKDINMNTHLARLMKIASDF
jgi:DNA (cytosine-5)-methyltransferase 1